MKRELERAQRERYKAILDRDQATLERDQAKLDGEQATLERDKTILDQDLLMAERVQEQRLQESVANCDQIKSELERLQRKQQGEKEDYDGTGCRKLETRVPDGGRRGSSGGRAVSSTWTVWPKNT